ncbi:MAG: GntR family transcriptional regulator [Rhodospirillaceae bacterium]|nr:GntR family transcriptional regulator [Rhodospirillaceae bacterium]
MDKAVSLGEDVFQRMLAKIDACELAPGEIINETSLAQEFGVSRGPVREAVRRLQGIQLVTREPYMRARVVTLSPREMIELFEMREAIEGYAARLAARRISERELDKLFEDLEAARSRKNARPAFDLHARLAMASGNTRIIDALCGDLYHLFRLYRRRSGDEGNRRTDAYHEHWQILRALQMRDEDLAESLMRSHIKRAAAHLSARLEAAGADGEPATASGRPGAGRRHRSLDAADG